MSEILNNSLRIKYFPKVHIVFDEVGPHDHVDSTGRGGRRPRGQCGAYLKQLRGTAWAKGHVGDGGA